MPFRFISYVMRFNFLSIAEALKNHDKIFRRYLQLPSSPEGFLLFSHDQLTYICKQAEGFCLEIYCCEVDSVWGM
jgi:hypothetical protein